MKSVLLSSLFVIFSTFYSTQAALSISLPSTHPDHPDKCWDRLTEITYSIGTHQPQNKCMEIHCSKHFSIVYVTCGVVVPPPGYIAYRDYTKKYPECCVNFAKVGSEQNSSSNKNNSKSDNDAVAPSENEILNDK